MNRNMFGGSIFLIVLFGTCVASMGGQKIALERQSLVGEGWHDWYEVKSDPQNGMNIIVCGSKLDTSRNAFLGFIYASSDGGMTWRSVLEDRSSTWVTEQSCAFGPEHRAYFISEASQVIDGKTHHDLGTTRLYVSTDGGQRWAETLKTAWADHSTSAVSATSGRLYTFFNSGFASRPSAEQGKNLGTTVGLLVFTPDGKNVEGPFFSSAIQDRDYYGSYPWGATALKSGTVVALYTALAGPPWKEADLGIIRADQSANPSLNNTLISHLILGKDCLYTDKASLTYSSEANRLFLVYGDGCKSRDVLLTSSDDEGRTWAKAVVLAGPDRPGHVIYSPSLVAGPKGTLGLLWRDGESASRWLFSYIQDQKLVEPPIELSNDPGNIQVSNDSLWTWITRPNERHGQAAVSEPSITLTVHNALNSVMNVLRINGAIAVGDKFLAVWGSGDSNGMRLNSGMLGSVDSIGKVQSSDAAKGSDDLDITQQSVLLYGGSQHFDTTAGRLEVCMILANRGGQSIKVPLMLEAKEVESPTGTVSILNANNGLVGAGARWDISRSVTGDRIPPGAQSNPFCLSFRIEIPSERATREGPDLLNLKVRVLGAAGEPRNELVSERKKDE
jgi:hypothetical protein